MDQTADYRCSRVHGCFAKVTDVLVRESNHIFRVLFSRREIAKTAESEGSSKNPLEALETRDAISARSFSCPPRR